jgi:hypothetical protein
MPEQRGRNDWTFSRLCLGGPETLAAAAFFEVNQPNGWFHRRVACESVFDAVTSRVVDELGADFQVHHDPAMAAAYNLVGWINTNTVVPTGLEIGDKAREIAAMARIVPEVVGAA